MLKQHKHRLDAGAVPAASTISTGSQGLLLGSDKQKRNSYPTRPGWCAYDGGELGSTGMRVKWSLPDDRVIGQSTNCKR